MLCSSTLTNIHDDMLVYMMEFLDVTFILGTCRLISKKWFEYTSKIQSLSIRTDLPLHVLDHFSVVEHLELSKQQHELKCVSVMNKLKSLKIHHSDLYDVNFVTKLTQLTNLDLGNNWVIGNDAFTIIANTQFVNLKSLNLCNNSGSDDGFQSLAESPNMRKLTILDLSYNKAGSDGIISIVKSENMRNLTWLNVIYQHEGPYAWGDISKRNSTIVEEEFRSSPLMKHVTCFVNDQSLFNACSREAVKYFMKQYGLSLKFLSKEIRNDKEIVLIAIKQNSQAYRYVSDTLKTNSEVVTCAIIQNGNVMKFIPKHVLNMDVVLMAVQFSGMSLEFVPQHFKDNKQVVLAAVAQNGHSLQFASSALRTDKQVVLIAVTQCGLSLCHALSDEALLQDREILVAALKQDIKAASFLKRNDRSRQVMLEMVKENANVLRYAHNFIGDRDIVLEAVKRDGKMLKFASILLETDREIVLAAVERFGKSLRYAHPSLQQNRRMVLAAVKQEATCGGGGTEWDPEFPFSILSLVPHSLRRVDLEISKYATMIAEREGFKETDVASP